MDEEWNLVPKIMQEIKSPHLEHLSFTFNGSSGTRPLLPNFSEPILKLYALKKLEFCMKHCDDGDCAVMGEWIRGLVHPWKGELVLYREPLPFRRLVNPFKVLLT